MLSLWQITRALFEGDSRLLVAQLLSLDDAGAPADGLTVDEAVVYQPLGLAVRPLVTRSLRALGFEHGDEVAVLKMWDKLASPTNLEAGETRLYAAGAITRVVRLLTARIDIEAPEIRLGEGATKKVNREGDAVDCGTLTFAFTPGSAAALAITYTPPGGGAPVSLPSGTGDIPLVGRTGAGSSKVRAGD